ncbi:hypothetical protein C8Q74DRAFT_769811 [Fomes fomentarius]|nr:hypothetical protein C8Q74DRAFT_769811 [Fomes fomentarius]
MDTIASGARTSKSPRMLLSWAPIFPGTQPNEVDHRDCDYILYDAALRYVTWRGSRSFLPWLRDSPTEGAENEGASYLHPAFNRLVHIILHPPSGSRHGAPHTATLFLRTGLSQLQRALGMSPLSPHTSSEQRSVATRIVLVNSQADRRTSALTIVQGEAWFGERDLCRIVFLQILRVLVRQEVRTHGIGSTMPVPTQLPPVPTTISRDTNDFALPTGDELDRLLQNHAFYYLFQEPHSTPFPIDIPWLGGGLHESPTISATPSDSADGPPISPQPYYPPRYGVVRWVGSFTFGLLRAVMGTEIPETLLLSVDAHGRSVVSGDRIGGILGLWRGHMIHRSSGPKDTFLVKGRQICHLLQNGFALIDAEYHAWAHGIFGHAGLDLNDRDDTLAAIACSMIALCGIAQSIWEDVPELKSLFASVSITGTRPFWGAVQASCKRTMRQAGWCPNAISDNFLMTIRESRLLFRLFRLQPYVRERVGEHRNCTEAACRFYTITDTDGYAPSHATPPCTCTSLSPSLDAVEQLLSEGDHGTIPVVVYDGDRLHVRSASDTPYIAISHVWADGMGSSTDRGLPMCQVLRLASYAKSLLPETHAFWIDSLCVPSATIPRRRAIKLMAKTYEDAACVLVIDKSFHWMHSSALSSLPLGRDRFLLSLALSGWVRRVWTLQEGLVARRLAFNLGTGDSTIEVEDIFRDIMEFEALLPDDSREDRLTRLLKSLQRRYRHVPIIALRLCRLFQDRFKGSHSYTFADIGEAMERRSISKPQDETLAIASLLSLDSDTLLSISDSNVETLAAKRMKSCLLQVQAVPRTLPFVISPKLPFYGFRWAPRSLTRAHSLSSDDGPQARCTERGLLGQYHFVPMNSVVPIRSDEVFEDLDPSDQNLVTWRASDQEGGEPTHMVLLHRYHEGVSIDGLLLLGFPSSSSLPSGQLIHCVAISRHSDEGWQSCGKGDEDDPILCGYVGFGQLVRLGASSSDDPVARMGEVREVYVCLS